MSRPKVVLPFPCLLLLMLIQLVGCRERHTASKRNGASRVTGTAAASQPLGREKSVVPLRAVYAGEILNKARQRQRAILLNIWASWCGPCRDELPLLASLRVKLEPRGIDVLLVSVDDPEDEPRVVQMMKEAGYPPPYYVAEGDLEPFKRTLHPRWPGNIPVTFLFDKEAKRRYFWGGPVYDEDLTPILDGFLAGKGIDGEADFSLSAGKVLR